ncbi:unnamed protein product [Polarella glacialis]|uniref:HEAT repeat-containing protein 1 n=1 Tax=Polarella glacialis TaxID=89957 RepID=A0A813IBN7_POLGL|nr:unnamed protein product [Polarella glacialis]
MADEQRRLLLALLLRVTFGQATADDEKRRLLPLLALLRRVAFDKTTADEQRRLLTFDRTKADVQRRLSLLPALLRTAFDKTKANKQRRLLLSLLPLTFGQDRPDRSGIGNLQAFRQ